MPRKFTNKLYDMVNDGLISPEIVVKACLNYMSEDEVKDMMECNEFIEEEEDE